VLYLQLISADLQEELPTRAVYDPPLSFQYSNTSAVRAKHALNAAIYELAGKLPVQSLWYIHLRRSELVLQPAPLSW
jgi:hypothetical protein